MQDEVGGVTRPALVAYLALPLLEAPGSVYDWLRRALKYVENCVAERPCLGRNIRGAIVADSACRVLLRCIELDLQ